MKTKLINNSVKVINIGKEILMPGAEMEVSAATANLPSVRAIAKMGLLTIEQDDSEERAAAAAKEKTEAEAKATAEKEAAEKAAAEEAKAKEEAEAKAKAEAAAKAKAEADKKAKEQK